MDAEARLAAMETALTARIRHHIEAMRDHKRGINWNLDHDYASRAVKLYRELLEHERALVSLWAVRRAGREGASRG